MVASKSALVAPIFTAMPTTWIRSPASGPTTWQPTTRSVTPSTTSFMNTRRVAPGQRRLHRPEAGLVDVDLGELLARLRLGEADHADFRLGEHRGRHVGVVDRRRLAAEHRIGEGVALADGDRREVDAVGHVADRVDVGDGGLRIGVDGDAAVFGELHAGRFQAETHDVRLAAGREHHHVGRHLLAIGQFDDR